MTDGGRPQDQGRSHKAQGRPSTETSTLLVTYQAAMRDELRAVLAEISGADAPAGLMPDAPKVKPNLADRIRMWDLAIKLGRELGTEVDVTPNTPPPVSTPAAPRRRGRVDYGPGL